jgi:hypothetical protein
MLTNCLNVCNKNKNQIRQKDFFRFFIIVPVGELVINKSAHHLKLEQALKKKKESIYRLSSNSSIVEELRNQTVDLIKELTSEIQREYKEEQERRKPS